MDAPPPELNFSLPELEQSGLLFHDATASIAPRYNKTWADAQLHAQLPPEFPQHDVAGGPSSGSAESPAAAQGQATATAGPANSSAVQLRAYNLQPVQEKRYNSREYQRKFRERQKVIETIILMRIPA